MKKQLFLRDNKYLQIWVRYSKGYQFQLNLILYNPKFGDINILN